MATKTDKGRITDSYLDLIHQFPLAPIKSNKELKDAQRIINALLSKGKLDGGEEDYLDVYYAAVAAIPDEFHALENLIRDEGQQQRLRTIEPVIQQELDFCRDTIRLRRERGSAAAVAAGMVPLALGSQTVGSVLRPATYCGVVGLKPTHGRIGSAGVFPLAPSFDHVGTFVFGGAQFGGG